MKKPMKKLLIKSSLLSVLIILSFACQPNQAILNSSIKNTESGATPTERPKDTFDAALKGVQRSGFKYIFVIRRKDGGQFNKEDKTYIRANSPAETNQFVLTDEERAIIAGSNYPFPEDSLETLRKVFNVEDLSPTPSENQNDAPESNSAESNSAESNSNQNVTNKVNENLNKQVK